MRDDRTFSTVAAFGEVDAAIERCGATIDRMLELEIEILREIGGAVGWSEEESNARLRGRLPEMEGWRTERMNELRRWILETRSASPRRNG